MKPPSPSLHDAEFKVFDSLCQKDKPDLALRGLWPIKCFGFKEKPGPHDPTPTDDVIARCAASIPLGGAAYFELEAVWPLRKFENNEWVVDRENLARMTNAMTVAQAHKPPGTLVGFFDGFPPRFQDAAAKSYSNVRRVHHRELARQLAGLTDVVDAWFPCWYVGEAVAQDIDLFCDSALIMLSVARQCAKPIYAFLSPQYGGTNVVSAPYWQAQLVFCRQHVDGAVIWGFPKESWDDSAPWWRATKEFMSDHGLDRPVPAPFVAGTGSQK
ncbi:MAG: hypothetical protein HQ581_14910 [Planctomycetes bacterium]|nr:hypothetical protein [Planctomycetota bacterium]